MPGDEIILGVISDTHGLLRPEAVAALEGSDLIIHAGDVGNPGVLDALRAIAPVVAIRGNIDTAPWAARLPVTAVAEAAGVRIYVLHDLGTLDLDPAASGFAIVISGHSHKPAVGRTSWPAIGMRPVYWPAGAGVLYINPGS